MKSYRQLSAEERVQIATLRSQNFALPRLLRCSGPFFPFLFITFWFNAGPL